MENDDERKKRNKSYSHMIKEDKHIIPIPRGAWVVQLTYKQDKKGTNTVIVKTRQAALWEPCNCHRQHFACFEV